MSIGGAPPQVTKKPAATPAFVNPKLEALTQERKCSYDPTKYRSYLEQLGITYPTIKK